MSAFVFSQRHFFDRFNGDRLRRAFAPRKPRSRLLRVATGLLGLVVVLALVFLGVFVGLAMLTAGVLLRLWRQRGKPVARASLHGDYRVIARTALPRA